MQHQANWSIYISLSGYTGLPFHIVPHNRVMLPLLPSNLAQAACLFQLFINHSSGFPFNYYTSLNTSYTCETLWAHDTYLYNFLTILLSLLPGFQAGQLAPNPHVGNKNVQVQNVQPPKHPAPKRPNAQNVPATKCPNPKTSQLQNVHSLKMSR